MKQPVKAMAKTVLAVVAAAALLLGIKNEYARLLPVSTYGMQAAIRQGEIDHLFIGSSMFRQGLDMEVLEQYGGERCFILSYNGNQPTFMADELQYMLEQGLTVKNLYIDMYPYTAAALPWISDTKILLDTDMAFKLQAWEKMRAGQKTAFSDLYEFFVTANNEQLLTWPLNNRLVSAQFRKGGSTLEPPGSTKEALGALELLGSREGLKPVQLRGYEKLCSLGEEYGFTVTFLETPKYIRMMQDPDYRELYEACKKEAEQLPGARLILAEELEFDHSEPAYFQDLIHLSGTGRKAYTKLLCRALEAEGRMP